MTSIKRRPRRRKRKPPVIGLSRLPDRPQKEIFIWADYAELRALTSSDGYVTNDDIFGWLRVDPIDSPPTPETSEDIVAQLEDGSQRDQSEPSRGTAPAAERTDNRVRKAEDVLRLLEYRSRLYGDDYPFVVNSLRLAARPFVDLTSTQVAYLFLLACANGRYVSAHPQLTKQFERVAARVLGLLLPIAETHVFGTASGGVGPFTGSNFRSNLEQLARMLGESTQSGVEDIDDDERGDRGLDVVALRSLDDLPGKLVVFGQAACTMDWVEKQHAPSSEAWDQLIQLQNPAVVACLVPYCFRKATGLTGRWHDRTKIHRRLLLDRRRILGLLATESDPIEVASVRAVRDLLGADHQSA